MGARFPGCQRRADSNATHPVVQRQLSASPATARPEATTASDAAEHIAAVAAVRDVRAMLAAAQLASSRCGGSVLRALQQANRQVRHTHAH